MKLALSAQLGFPTKVITSRLAVMGTSDSGKTYTSMKLAELMLEVGAQIVALDLAGVWWGLRASKSGKRAGFPITIFGGDHGDIPLAPNSGKLIAEVIVSKNISAVCDLTDFTLGQLYTWMGDYHERLFELKRKKRTVMHEFLEEAHVVLPQERMEKGPEFNRMVHRVERNVRVLRNHGVGHTMISQFPQYIRKSSFDLAEIIIAHRLGGTAARKKVCEWVESKSQEDAGLFDRLKSLETGQSWLSSPYLLKYDGLIFTAERKTFDSGETPEFGRRRREPKKLAPVDVAALKAAMLEGGGEVEDVGELKARVKSLEGERRMLLEKLGRAGKAAHNVSEAEFEQAVRRGFKAGEASQRGKVEYIRTPMLGKMEARQLRKLITQAGLFYTKASRIFENVSKRTWHSVPEVNAVEVEGAAVPRAVRDGLPLRAAGFVKPRHNSRAPTLRERFVAAGDPGGYLPLKEDSQGAKPTSPPLFNGHEMAEVARVADTEPPLSPYAQDLLKTVAARHPMELTRSQLGILSKRSLRSSAFQTAVAALLKFKWLEQKGNSLVLAERALAEGMGAGAQEALAPPAELRAMWKEKLPKYPRALFEVLTVAPEKSFIRAELADHAGKSIKSSAFQTAVASLIRNKLAVCDVHGGITLAPELR